MEPKKTNIIVDAWVVRYDDMVQHLISIGIPPEKAKDYDWVKINIKRYCSSSVVFETLKNLKQLYGY